MDVVMLLVADKELCLVFRISLPLQGSWVAAHRVCEPYPELVRTPSWCLEYRRSLA